MGNDVILTKGVWAVVNIFFCKRINAKKPSELRLMISPFERIPTKTKIINMFLTLKFPALICAGRFWNELNVNPNG